MLDFGPGGRIWLRGALDATALAALDDGYLLSDMAANKPGARFDLSPQFNTAFGPQSALALALKARFGAVMPVRIVGFDKSAGQNWSVPWHQDRVIAVRDRHAVPGFDNWTQKKGVWHCEPPVRVLRSMVYARLHLDNCTAANGAMEIALGSHAHGVIPMSKAGKIAASLPTEVTVAQRGDVLLMDMFMLHRSRPAQETQARRTLRVDFATSVPPMPLEWAI